MGRIPSDGPVAIQEVKQLGDRTVGGTKAIG